jgi:NADH dehydrogenase
MAAINDLIRDAAKNYPRVPLDEIRTILIHSRDRLLQELDEGLAHYAQKKLEERGVEMILNARVTAAGSDFVEIHGNQRISTYCLIWTAGTAIHPVLPDLDCAHAKNGGLKADACCRVEGTENVWALGDCAEIPQPDGKTYAPTAQNAIRQGARVAQNILAELRGEEQQPFTYVPIAELALVGRRSGIARVYDFKFSGIIAWMLWRTVYLLKMPDRGDQLRIAIDWTLDLFLGREIAVLPNTIPARGERIQDEELKPLNA